jgi:hypothetical protein
LLNSWFYCHHRDTEVTEFFSASEHQNLCVLCASVVIFYSYLVTVKE